MLRVKVQSCKWECLLCSRTFNSKFCYLLHSKNVHGKIETHHVHDSIIRPKSARRKFFTLKKRSRYSTRSSDVQCCICKKNYSTQERLRRHQKFHLNKTKPGWDKDKEDQDDTVEGENTAANKTTKDNEGSMKDGEVDGVNGKKGKKRGRPKGKPNRDKTQDTENKSEKKVERKRGRPRKERHENEVKKQDNVKEQKKVKESQENAVAPTSDQSEKQATPADPPPKKPRGNKKLPRECTVCKKVFANRSSLRDHTRIHTGEKPYTCSVCEKGFIRMGHLKQHMCSHTGLWPFKCGTCGKGFMNPSRVSRHMRVHSDERPYVCDACGEGFKEPHHLTRHLFLHTGEKPFKCPICQDRYFIQPGNLRIHMKTHEKDISDATAVVGDVSHEVVASFVHLPEVKNGQEQQEALESLATVSMVHHEATESNRDSSENLENEHGYSEKRGESHDDESRDATAEQSVSNSTTDKNNGKNEILLQIMPSLAPALQIQGFQELSSIDQEFLRQFASSVAQELVNSQ